MTKEFEIALEKEGPGIEVNIMDGEIYAIRGSCSSSKYI